MARHPAASDDDEEEPDVSEDGEDDEPEPAPSRGARRKRGHAPPVREWGKANGEDSEEEPTSEKPPVYWRARDSLWFEPLVALAIVVLLLVGLYAYAQNWPPVYVVESMSMQHGTDDHLGLINTGDLVLAQKINSGQVTTYVDGLQNGYTTYGEYGDVLLYHPFDNTGVSPVIHRAIIYLQHNTDGTWSAPSLGGLSCSHGSYPYYQVSTSSGCGFLHLSASDTITLYHIGWQSANVLIPLQQMGMDSGYVTMGDNNYLPGTPAQGEPDQTNDISSLVQPGWILGVARGMIPWFGAIKLLLEGQASMVPAQSWQLMGVTIAAILLAAIGLHLALRRGRSDEESDPDTEDHESLGARFKGFFHRHDDEDEGEDEPNPSPRGRQVKPISKEKLLRHHRGKSGGRPRPSVRRSHAAHSPHHSESDSL